MKRPWAKTAGLALRTSPIGAALWRLADRTQKRAGGAIKTRWQLGAIAPAVIVAIFLAVTSAAYLNIRHYSWPYGFVDIGTEYARHIGLQRLAVSDIGYDGQFSYYMALDPRIIVVCAHDQRVCPMSFPLLRSERIFYPALARLLAFNQPGGLPYTMYIINFVAILITVILVGQMCVESSTSRWLGAAVGLFWGEVLGLVQDVGEPLAMMWLVLAVWCARRNQPRWAAAAIAAALLTREQLILFVPLLALPWIVRRRWRIVAQCAVIAGVPFLAWQVALSAIYGQFALTASSASAPLVLLPFAGLWQDRAEAQWEVIVLFIVVPILITLVVGLLALLRQGLRGALDDPVPLLVAVYCVALTFTSFYQWHEMFTPARLAAPAIALGALAAGYVPRWLRVSFAASLIVGAAVLVSAYVLPAV